MVVGAWAAGCGLLLVSARSDLNQGVASVEAARAAGPGAGALKGQSLPELRQAEAAFHRAHSRVSSPVMAPAGWLPAVGRQLRSVRDLSGSAEKVVAVGIEAVTAASAEFDRPQQTGPSRVELVRALSRISARSVQQLEGLRLGPSEGLVGPLADARERFVREVDEARTALRKLAASGSALTPLLAGPRRYLVFAANNAEMRAGGGMPLSYGVLEIRDGIFTLASMESVGSLPRVPSGVSVDPDLAAAWNPFNPNQAWFNTNMTPRFPATAEALSRMWGAIGRGSVDGVMLVDPVALKAILGSTGPVSVPGGTVSADTVVKDVLHDQYRGVAVGDLRRRDRLSDISVATIRAANGGLDVSRLGQDLYAAIRGRHLLAWSSRAEEQQGWKAMGADGTLASDSMMVSVLSRGGNKLDQFLDVDASLEVAGREATLSLELTNRTPAGEPPYVLGYFQFLKVPPGTYTGIATVNLPEGSELLDAGAFLPRGQDGPTGVVVSPVQLKAGESKQLAVRFRLPPEREAVWVEPSARLPATHWRSGGQEWDDERGRAVPVGTTSRL